MNIDRYKVYNHTGWVLYTCSTQQLSEQQVIEQIENRFKYNTKRWKIEKNGKIIKRYNFINDTIRPTHRIQDTESGDIFVDCHELADHLGISYREAKRKAYTMFKYKIIK